MKVRRADKSAEPQVRFNPVSLGGEGVLSTSTKDALPRHMGREPTKSSFTALAS